MGHKTKRPAIIVRIRKILCWKGWIFKKNVLIFSGVNICGQYNTAKKGTQYFYWFMRGSLIRKFRGNRHILVKIFV